MSFGMIGGRRNDGFFRGKELPTLLVLIAILIAGSLAIANQFWTEAAAKQAPPVTVNKAVLKPIEPDTSEEFAGVKDLTETTLFDNAPKKLLLERARNLTADQLDAESHRDVLFTHLWERPQQYRGIPVHLQGTALRLITYEVSKEISPSGRLYEIWINTPESQRFPYCCLFEDLPNNFPIGSNISEFVSFNGYFLKNMAYVAGDKPRGAPLLVGKLGWRPQTQARGAAGAGAPPRPAWNKMPILLGALFLYIGVRSLLMIKRLFAPRPERDPSKVMLTVDPEPSVDLGQILAQAADEEGFEESPRTHG